MKKRTAKNTKLAATIEPNRKNLTLVKDALIEKVKRDAAEIASLKAERLRLHEVIAEVSKERDEERAAADRLEKVVRSL